MQQFMVAVCALAVFGIAHPAHAAERITPGRSLSVSFDLVPTPWVGQPEVYDPNLVFLEFRGGVSFSPNAAVTATLFIDGVEVGSTTSDTNCSLCSSATWQFAAAGFPDVPQFPNPTVIDFAPVLSGNKGTIVLTVVSGYMTFGGAPYEANAPVVITDNIASCGPSCIAIRPVTLDAQNETWNVGPTGFGPR